VTENTSTEPKVEITVRTRIAGVAATATADDRAMVSARVDAARRSAPTDPTGGPRADAELADREGDAVAADDGR